MALVLPLIEVVVLTLAYKIMVIQIRDKRILVLRQAYILAMLYAFGLRFDHLLQFIDFSLGVVGFG